MKYNSISPGKIWLDTSGKPIQAHGGSIIFWNNIYYWYGENKEFTTGDREYWHNGVKMYSSTDLYNWNDEGIIIPAEEDTKSSLYRKSCMDRPHIIYNKKTNKFVCYLKIMNSDNTQSFTILTADSLLGPYTKVKEKYYPLGMNSGDFDLVVDEFTGKAYVYFEKVHTETICATLTDDYLSCTGEYTSHFIHKEGPPFVREGTSYFFHNGKHYLITSGTTGYKPNPSEIAIANSYHGPFKVLGNLHKNDKTNTSFHSQISSVFKVPGKKDFYIALADRWIPNRMDYVYDKEKMSKGLVQRIKDLFIEYGIDPQKNPDQAEQLFREKIGFDEETNTSIATYVWLPLHFDGDNVYIDYVDRFKIE